MRQNTNILRSLGRDARGATAIEYGFLAALISIAFIMGAAAMGTSLNNLTQSSADELDIVIANMAGISAASEDSDGGKDKKGKKDKKGHKGD